MQLLVAAFGLLIGPGAHLLHHRANHSHDGGSVGTLRDLVGQRRRELQQAAFGHGEAHAHAHLHPHPHPDGGATPSGSARVDGDAGAPMEFSLHGSGSLAHFGAALRAAALVTVAMAIEQVIELHRAAAPSLYAQRHPYDPHLARGPPQARVS